MSTFYIDLDNGNDSSDGTTWGNAWKTITSGATAARIAPGDVIRISKTPDPTSIGNGTWTSVSSATAPSTIIISSSTNASPIEITTSSNHNYSTGDIIQIIGHTTNTSANGTWKITYVSSTKLTLNNSVGVGVGGATGTTQKVDWKSVVLATAQTATIDRCEAAWTANGSGDCTVALTAVSTDAKEGGYCMKFTLDSSVQTSTLQAYKTISSTNFSSYQKISFWIKNEAAIVANNWQIKLCSDTAGATAVDTFDIPAIPSTGRWLPLTLTKSGGGNLGSTIQSIALYSGSSNTGMASKYIYLDNIVGCTTSGLNLQSLISKNGSAQGGTEAYYGLQSISEDGTILMLDNDTNNKSNLGRGYTGTTETVTTYKRETFKTVLTTSSSGNVSVINDSGSASSLILFEFGYEVGTTNQNGETHLDGLNGWGNGIYANNKLYITYNYVSLYRYQYSFNMNSSHYNILNNISNVNNNNSSGIFLNSSNSCEINVTNSNNNNSYGVSTYGAEDNKIFLTNSNNQLSSGLYLYLSTGNYVYNLSAKNNFSYSISFNMANDNIIYNLVSMYNGNSGIGTVIGDNYLRNPSISETVEVSPSQYYLSWIWSKKHDTTENNDWGFTYGATCNWQTGTVHSSEPGSWKTVISSSIRNSFCKVKIPVCEVAGTASTAMTIKAWVKKDHATNIACRLVHYADSLLGTTEQAATKASDTDWEELSISVTPTSTNPVVKVWLETWYVAGNSNSYLGTITVT